MHNEYVIAKTGADTTDNGSNFVKFCTVWPKHRFTTALAIPLLGSQVLPTGHGLPRGARGARWRGGTGDHSFFFDAGVGWASADGCCLTFGSFVLGRIEADFCKQEFSLQHLGRFSGNDEKRPSLD